MGTEENKAIVLRHLESAEMGGDDSLLHEDIRYWIPGLGSIGRLEFAKIINRLGPVLRTPVHLTVDHVTAEDNRVAVEARGRAETADGRLYENTYHFLFILQDGKIIEQHEHTNTALAYAILGTSLTEGIDT
jgi:ketosteroid isomerase-like protein